MAGAGCSDLYVWNMKDLSQPPQKTLVPDCTEISCMIRVKRQVR